MRSEVLITLDLTDNNIGEEGCKYLSHALKVNKNLRTFSLKLNNINDKSGERFFRDLKEN